MSPFDLQGPEFLVFYLVFAGLILVALLFWRSIGGEPDPSAINPSDPYLIAYLRGGKNEALRVATVSLIDRGMLRVSGKSVFAASDATAAGLRLPIEISVRSFFKSGADAASIFKAPPPFDIGHYERELVRLDLMPGPELKSAQRLQFIVVLLLLWGLALTKIAVALSRGRSNIQFLIILAIVFSLISWKLALPRLTRKGESMQSSLRTLFSGLKERAASLLPGRNANELLLLAAVFGIAMIPSNVFPYTKELYPQASGASGSSCGSSCGSGCGGGGCGGCGGGCGGCGS